jgi:membrane fusion protein
MLAAAKRKPSSPAPSDLPPLFRPEVATRNWDILASRGLLPRVPRLTSLVLVILLLAFGASTVFIARGALPRVEFVHGYLEPVGGVARIRAPRQAIVGAVHVKDGQLVNEGDSLVTLQSGQTTESGAAAEAEIARQLQSQKRDLDSQIARETEWRKNEEERLVTEADQLARDIDLLNATMQTQRDQIQLAQRHAERIRELAERGTVSLDELQKRDMAVLAQRVILQNSEREQASKRAQLRVARIAIEQLPTVASERLRGLRESLANVQQRLIELETRRAVIVRAPVSGRVAAVTTVLGAALDSGSLLATIVPEKTELRARLLVPTRAIGKVHPGQVVAIRYDAFPYQKYGTFAGKVEDVSNTVLLPEEIGRTSPVKLNEAAYVLEVAIHRQSVALGDDHQAALRPDMSLTATIEVDRRPLLAWIGESVFGVSQH